MPRPSSCMGSAGPASAARTCAPGSSRTTDGSPPRWRAWVRNHRPERFRRGGRSPGRARGRRGSAPGRPSPASDQLTMQIHLLDATYELFRAHFGRPPHADANGKPVGATLGLIESVLSLLREDGVTHLGCATDHVIESWRNKRFAGYKSSAGVPPELLAQFQLAEDALRAIGCVVWPEVEFEADDALATAAERFVDAPGVQRIVV